MTRHAFLLLSWPAIFAPVASADGYACQGWMAAGGAAAEKEEEKKDEPEEESDEVTFFFSSVACTDNYADWKYTLVSRHVAGFVHSCPLHLIIPLFVKHPWHECL